MKLKPRARKVKFRLNIRNHEIIDIEKLCQNFSLLEIKKLVESGQFLRWLEYLGETSLAEKINNWKENGSDSLSLIKIFFDDYQECNSLKEVFFKEFDSNEDKILMEELLTLIDDPQFVDELIALGNKDLINKFIQHHGNPSGNPQLEDNLRKLGIRNAISSERWEMPPKKYFPKDFSGYDGSTFLDFVNSAREIPGWFKENQIRIDMWEFLSITCKILERLRGNSNYDKASILSSARELCQFSDSHNFVLEAYFIAALVFKKYDAQDFDSQVPNKERLMAPIKNYYIPARILYEHWETPINNKLTFYSTLWEQNTAYLKNERFLMLSLGEQICVVIANLFETSLYE